MDRGLELARLILQADGYAPVTAIVYWPGQQRAVSGPPATSAGIEFSGKRDIRIEEGSSQSIDIAFRRSFPELLRIVDESGRPAAEISLDASIFFDATNRMEVVEGESLIQGKTDANGQTTIPDVDGELAIELQRGFYVLQDPDRVNPFRKVITPAGTMDVTALVLHRFQKQPLNINFVNRNGSAAGLTLGTCLKFCAGACCGDMATTDTMGQVRVEDFYPEEIDSLYLTDKFGPVLWKGNAPHNIDSTAIPTITIPPASR